MNETIKVKAEIPEVSKNLWNYLEGKGMLYLSWDVDLSDFRSNRSFNLQVHSKNSPTLEIPVLRQQFTSFVGILGASLFNSDRLIVGWNLKELFSYLRFHLPRHFRIPVSSRFVDLKLIESFADCEGNGPPLNYEEAMKRTAKVLKDDSAIKMNRLIYMPLAVEVVPSIETLGLANRETGRLNYSSYNIEGTANGRMTTTANFDGCFTPQNLSDEAKRKFSAGNEKKFVVFDYKHMEVSVLHWLSQDPVLGEIITSGEDIYSAIYRNLTSSSACSAQKRKWIKGIFLPIVFGAGADRISGMSGVPVNGAKALIGMVKEKFPVAMGWVQSKYEEVLANPTIKDVFGRTLYFGEGSKKDPWDVRNYIVSAPAAMICLEKLIKLYQQRYTSMEVVASIHDAYVCTVDNLLVEPVAKHAKELLESPSELAPDLKLTVGIEAGDSWGDTHQINLD